MGNYQHVVREQMHLLRTCGLADELVKLKDAVQVTHVGEGLDWVQQEAKRQDVPIEIVAHDDNVMHYETFAMMHIEKLAKERMTWRPIMYLHTKGVSNPGDEGKQHWRHVMEYHTVTNWRDRVQDLEVKDVCGWNYFDRHPRHFSGTFWTARAHYIRALADFREHHRRWNMERYSCEMWIGTSPKINPHSLGAMNLWVMNAGFDWTPYLPPYVAPPAEITWVTCATPDYEQDMAALKESFAMIGPGHRLKCHSIPAEGRWDASRKFPILQYELRHLATSHLAWIDADMLVRTRIHPCDIVDLVKPLFATQHVGFTYPREVMPNRWKSAVLHNHPIYYQSCLFGGAGEDMGRLLQAVQAWRAQGMTYDEHALNIEWDREGPERVRALPTRYCWPTNWTRLGPFAATCHERAGGWSRIDHHNREIHR
jgi:hypothetical protein